MIETKQKAINDHVADYKNSGQVIVEYMLLLVVVVAIAVLISRELVSRKSGEEGLVIRKWQSVMRVIGKDHPDDLN